MTPMITLFVDDEDHLRIAAAQALDLADLPVRTLSSGEAALAALSRDLPGILVTDIRMPGLSGVELLDAAVRLDPDLPVIMVTGHGDVELAVDCMRRGAYDFIEKPYDPRRLVETIRRALEKRRLTLENRALRLALTDMPAVERRLAGTSPAILSVRRKIAALAAMETDIIITGATGTGTEVAARLVHELSSRSAFPFVQVDCAALPADMVEIELFGHEAGAFPAAHRARFGKFEHARGGTVFLDAIDNLPLPLQAKLLAAVEQRRITRLGSNDPVELDLRFIVAMRPEPKDALAAGVLRDDLYYRVSGAHLRMPSLAERRDDIARLFAEFTGVAAMRHGRPVPAMPASLMAGLVGRQWPGNVRELRNLAERFVLGLDATDDNPPQSAHPSLADMLADHERALIAASLAAHGGSLKATYEALGISRKALYEKMQRHGLHREDFRDDDEAAPAHGSPR